MQTRTDYAKRNIKWALLQRLIFVLCPFLIRALLIQKFSSEYLGLSGLCTSILSVLNMAEMGFSIAVLFCLYKPVADNDIKQRSDRIFRSQNPQFQAVLSHHPGGHGQYIPQTG